MKKQRPDKVYLKPCRECESNTYLKVRRDDDNNWGVYCICGNKKEGFESFTKAVTGWNGTQSN